MRRNSGNGAREGAENAAFFLRDETFAALDALDPPVRAALYEAPLPYSPVQVRDYGIANGIRGERLADVVRAMSGQQFAAARRAIDMKLGYTKRPGMR